MKVLIVNGSPHMKGTTYKGIEVVAQELNEQGIETEIFWIGNKPMSGCIACGKCKETGTCVFDDKVNKFREMAKYADGFIFATPVHYAGVAGNMASFMDRFFYSSVYSPGENVVRLKPVASIIAARRAGTTAAFDQINKYFTISEMPVISSTYWNMIHGSNYDQAAEDIEGVETMRNLGTNMAYFLKCIEAAKDNNIMAPESKKKTFTNFIR